MLLDDKTAIIYGGAGAIGSAAARAFAREGAHVFLASRTAAPLERLAQTIRADGGVADAATVDVLDAGTVEAHAAGIVAAHGRIDVCLNATSNDDVQGTPLLEMTRADFLQPVTKAVTAHFNIATAVGRHMAAAGAGVILVMAGGREAISRLGGSHVAWSALAGLCRQLAAELGPANVRVNWLLSPGSPGTQLPDDGRDDQPSSGLLRRYQPSYEEVANIAVFAASDWARTMTAAEINFTGGAIVD
jgi:3-oxoacyl-[acyl-carrier protein] reductase